MENSNVYVDGILWGGDSLNSNTISYSFWNDASLDDAFFDTDRSSTGWFNSEKASMQQALTTWSNVANISFVQVADDTASADLAFSLVNDSELDGGTLGSFAPPKTFGEGIGYFNEEGLGWDATGLQQGGYGFITLIHELGHGLGLAHPHDNGGGSSVYPGVESAEDLGDNDLNQGIWTTMSYNDGWESENGDLVAAGITEYGYQGTPMAFDIAAIQSLYGANMSYNTGDDVYVLPDTNTAGTFYSAIWDAGGTDTISALTATVDATINLNDAPLVGENAGGFVSAVNNVYGGFTIANGVDIEVAVGGSGDDTLIGNEVDNLLYGWSGSDSLYGGSGDDLLDGYGGISGEYDTLSGDYSYSEPNKAVRLDGADTFVLGDASGTYYLGLGYATITDFYWAEDDKIQVYGVETDYSLGFESWSGGEAIDTLIYYQSDLIGVVQDTTEVIASLDFTFV